MTFMKSFTNKERLVFLVCSLLSIIFLAKGILSYSSGSITNWELINIVAVFLIFLGVGLSPKVFFTPLKQLFSSSHLPQTVINRKLQQTILLSGLLLALICVIEQVY